MEGDLRRIPLSRRSHVIGFQPFSTGITEHESALERDFVTLTRFLDAGATVTSQPTTIRFQHAGDRRRYPNRERVSDLRNPVSETRHTDTAGVPIPQFLRPPRAPKVYLLAANLWINHNKSLISLASPLGLEPRTP